MDIQKMGKILLVVTLSDRSSVNLIYSKLNVISGYVVFKCFKSHF